MGCCWHFSQKSPAPKSTENSPNMTRHLKLSPRDKRKIDHLYLKGFKAAEICAELRHLNLTPRQVTQFLYKRGLTKQRTAIEETKQRTALEILERVRREGVEDFESVILDISAGLKIDAKQLRNGWDMAQDAAGASSLMRAKSLHLGRALAFFGLDKPDRAPPPAGVGLNLFFMGAASPSHTQPTDPDTTKSTDSRITDIL